MHPMPTVKFHGGKFGHSVLARDLSAILKRSSTLVRNSIVVLVLGSAVLMLFAIVIRINIMLNLFDFSHALNKAFSSSLLLLVRAAGFSYSSATSRSSTQR